MKHTSSPVRRFGPDFVEDQVRRFGRRPAEQRQLTYDIAVQDDYEPWRAWLDEQLALLPENEADTLARKIWLDEHFWAVITELAAGAGLRDAGLEVAYERPWDGGLTPDWTVLSDRGEPAAMVEVHTDSPSRDTYGQMRAWHGLVQRIRQIPVSVVLTLAATGSPVLPPDPHTAKKIFQDLRRELMQPWRRAYFHSHGYTFLVMADPAGGGTMSSPLGLAACFQPPSCMAGTVSAEQVAERMEDKVGKYRHLSAQHDVPLIVAVGSHRFTGLDVKHLDTLLAGRPTTSLQFNFGDVYYGAPTKINLGRPPRWEMPDDLAGVLWVHNEFPFQVSWRPNPEARRPAPRELAGSRAGQPTVR